MSIIPVNQHEHSSPESSQYVENPASPAIGLVNRQRFSILLYQLLWVVFLTASATDAFNGFITRHDDMLFDGDTVVRFISFNVPNLHLVEDDFVFTDTNNWRLPDAFEIHDAFRSVQQAGGTVIRIYCLRIQKHDEPEIGPKHLTAPRTYNEEAFRVLDTVLALANDYGIRLIIPFLEGPPWWGPEREFARMRNRTFDSREVRDDYKNLVSTLINRRNTVTGSLYRDDKAILCWETGNEMPTSGSWLSEMAAFIKHADPNHLLMDGNYGVRTVALENPDIDIVTNHFYKTPACIVRHDLHMIRGRKAYIIGEWGWSLQRTQDIIALTLDNRSVSGALIWSLRFHFREGGFTWHKGEGLHWPGGFTREELDNEAAILAAVRKDAFTIRGLAVPPFPPPLQPTLLPITAPPMISWEGSAGANRYTVERANDPQGPWTCIADSIDDTRTAYRPLFCDTSAPIDSTCFYRVIACGPGGCSPPSLPSPPVHISCRLLIDEFIPGEERFCNTSGIRPATETPWRFKYDFERIRGRRGAHVDYCISGTAVQLRLFAFLRKDGEPFSLAASPDGEHFVPVPLEFSRYPYCCANPKDHLRLPVLAETYELPPNARFIRIIFEKSGVQLGRCEIGYR